ncbi:MAG: hypothetical protein LBH85_00025 [Treponema sp.]|jgi:hypothetical protein|nr:hypothetical protein [Treponema sp.]
MSGVFALLASPLGVVILIAYWLATPLLGRWVAGEKGYSTGAWFWLCLFLGVFALIAICGAPDKSSEFQLKELHRKFSNPPSGGSSQLSPQNAPPIAADPVKGDFWVCKKCGMKNRAAEAACKGCGSYR